MLSRLCARSAGQTLRPVRRRAGSASAEQLAGPFAAGAAQPVLLSRQPGILPLEQLQGPVVWPDAGGCSNPQLFFDDRDIRERLSYYLIVNQIFSVAARAGHDGLASEAELLGILRARLKKLGGRTHWRRPGIRVQPAGQAAHHRKGQPGNPAAGCR
ncbi:ferric iron reductase [Mesorhizobium onobrychidis]|uniref:ferric iron reductase n=1 Tax=Mesorhizobium onobrychidis TaxID=2775404 RepID=UPI0035A98B62